WASVTPLGCTGRVTFYVDGNPIGTAAVNTLNGLATLLSSTLVPGTHTITASFPGDSHCKPSTSAGYTQVVDPVPSSVVLAISPTPSVCQQTVTLTATLTPSDATGTVTFSDGAAPLGTATVASGVATLEAALTTSGTHTLHASYSGDVFYTGSSATPQ